MESDLAEGTVVAGRFRLERLIGQGGMGVVWAATNTVTLRRVALKMLKPESASDERVRRRFLREGRAASAVRHPNVVEILDMIELENGAPAMVMELLEGESFAQLLRREKMFSVSEAAAIMLPAISAVGAAHALGIVHRDLKPDNIFLSRWPDGTCTVKVLDFGIAKVSALDKEATGGTTDGLTDTGAMIGTPHYMSPEQIFSDARIDYRSDIWALGIILYECLAGVRPTKAENVGQIMKLIMSGAIVPIEAIRPELPSDVTSLIGRMLSGEREDRPQSLHEVTDILRAHCDIDVLTFGDPVLVNVGAGGTNSSSGSHSGTTGSRAGGSGAPRRHSVIPGSRSGGSGSRPRSVRSLPPPRSASGTAETRADAQGMPTRAERAASGPQTAATETLNSLGLSVTGSHRRPARNKRWWGYAAGAGAVLVGGAVVAALMWRTPGRSTSDTINAAVAAPPPVSAAASAPPAAADASQAPAPNTESTSDARDAGAAAAASVAKVAEAPRARPKPTPASRLVPVPPATAATADAPSAPSSAPVNAPGGLVEKPPF